MRPNDGTYVVVVLGIRKEIVENNAFCSRNHWTTVRNDVSVDLDVFGEISDSGHRCYIEKGTFSFWMNWNVFQGRPVLTEIVESENCTISEPIQVPKRKRMRRICPFRYFIIVRLCVMGDTTISKLRPLKVNPFVTKLKLFRSNRFRVCNRSDE